MFGVGQGELALILLFAFMIFGPDKLPGAGRTLGRALRQFRQAQEGFSKVVQTEVINPMTQDSDDTPSIEDELDADIEDEGSESTPKVLPHHKESFAERKARLDAERKAKEEEEAKAAAAAALAEAEFKPEETEVTDYKPEETAAGSTQETVSEAADKSEEAGEATVADAPEATPAPAAATATDDDADADTDSAPDAEAEIEVELEPEPEPEPNPLAALYGLDDESLSRVQEVSTQLDERDLQRKSEAAADFTPQDVAEAALTEPEEATPAEPEEEAASQVRVVTAARKKPRASRPQTTEPGEGEGAE